MTSVETLAKHLHQHDNQGLRWDILFSEFHGVVIIARYRGLGNGNPWFLFGDRGRPDKMPPADGTVFIDSRYAGCLESIFTIEAKETSP